MDFVKRALPILSLLSALSLTSVAWAGTLKVEGKPKVTFFAVGSPSFLNIEGTTTTLNLADDGSTLKFSVPMKTVDSGVELRDEHMRDKYVHVETTPDAIISFKKADIPWNAAASYAALSGQPACMLYAAQFSKEGAGRYIAAGGSGTNECKVFDHLNNNEVVGTVSGLSRGVFTVDFSPDNEKMAIAGGDASIRILHIGKKEDE